MSHKCLETGATICHCYQSSNTRMTMLGRFRLNWFMCAYKGKITFFGSLVAVGLSNRIVKCPHYKF